MSLVNCKECGNRVSSYADKCPHCGIKISRHLSVREILIGLISTVIGVFIAISFNRTPVPATESISAIENAPRNTKIFHKSTQLDPVQPLVQIEQEQPILQAIEEKEQPVEEPIEENKQSNHALESTAFEIANDYNENTVKADEKYKGKRIKIIGIISKVNTGSENAPFITMKSGNGFNAPQISFDNLLSQKVSTFKKGQIVSVICTGNGKVGKTPMFDNCQISDVQVVNQQSQQREEMPEDNVSMVTNKKQVAAPNELNAANDRINAIWQSTTQEIRQKLLPEQRAWLKQRETDCAAQHDKNHCMATMTDNRIMELKQKIDSFSANQKEELVVTIPNKLDEANDRINAVWQGTTQEIRQKLLPEQSAWLKQREDDCAAQNDKIHCMATMTDNRIEELKQKIAFFSVAQKEPPVLNELDAANDRINAVWQGTTQEVRQKLLQKQRAWLKQREDDCATQEDRIYCMATMTDKRIEELKHEIENAQKETNEETAR